MSKVIKSLKEFIRGDLALCVVKAPPGSGKTYTLIESLEVVIKSKLRVVIVAQTNNQVDQICQRIVQRFTAQTVYRYSSKSYDAPSDGHERVSVVKHSSGLPVRSGIVVGTASKFGLSELDGQFDLLFVDEAWQMAWADFLPMRHIAPRYILIGDPGQIPPTIGIEVDRWESSYFQPHVATPQIILANPKLADDLLALEIAVCRRLPADSTTLVNGFYDFKFESDAQPGERFIRPTRQVAVDSLADDSVDRALQQMWQSKEPYSTSMIGYPTQVSGPASGTDLELAAFVGDIVKRLLDRKCEISTGPHERDKPRQLTINDIGVVSTHNQMNTAIQHVLVGIKKSYEKIRVTTPERWQGLEKPIMIAVHPLSGVTSPSGFDLETGRLCVMSSRHEAACFFVTRDHISETLDSHLPSADQALGCADLVGRGHAMHRQFLLYHEQRNLIV